MVSTHSYFRCKATRFRSNLKYYCLISLFFISTSTFANYQSPFQKAIINAAMHEQVISTPPLTTLDGSFVRMAVFTTYTGYKTTDNLLGSTIWVTVATDMKKHCSQYTKQNKSLNIWIAQLLGISIDTAEQRRFVIMDIPVIQAYYGSSPKTIGIFRPCTDPRIYQHNDDTPTCPKLMNNSDTAISTDFKTWFINNSINAYNNENGAPWTEYGYTYNWNEEAKSVLGITEFVVLKNTPVTILANPMDTSTPYLSAEQFCKS